MYIDNESPIFNALFDIEHDTDPGKATATLTLPTPHATDNSGRVTVASSHQETYIFPIGETEVTFTASDPYGNIAINEIVVAVRGKMVFLM